MLARHLEALVFSLKAAVAAVVAVLCYDLFGWQGAMWAAISAVLVTQPTLHPSVKASWVRVAANCIGAFIGAGLSTLLGHTLVSIAAGVMLTVLACHFVQLDDGLRPACAALLIVLMRSDTSSWIGPLDRVAAVLIGCLCALVVGFAFDKSADAVRLLRNPAPAPADGGEDR